MKYVKPESNLMHDLFLPSILFAALGAMSWAVRGCSGFGGAAGCLFAGVLWGAAWWYISREPGAIQPRRYASGWVILALTLGISWSGGRGWAQWSTFFEGRLQTNTAAGDFEAISPVYGFIWLFIAGMPWAGIGACLLAGCGSHKRNDWQVWIIRAACGVAGFYIARYLFRELPQVFLPLYSAFEAKYQDLENNPNLRRVMNDNRAAISHLGVYLGFLSFELGRRDWRNAILILTVGIINGIGWACFQAFWQHADEIWPAAHFNWWRCWESSGGISIGIAYGVAFYLVNRPRTEEEWRAETGGVLNPAPNLERFAVYLGLVWGLGNSIRYGLKGWANIYIGNEEYWADLLWKIFGPSMLVLMVALGIWILRNKLPRGYTGNVFPHAYKLLWVTFIIQNILAQLVTGPHTGWPEVAFCIYYIFLLILSAVIVYHYRWVKQRDAEWVGE